MKSIHVIHSEEVPFYDVAWGKTKGIVAKESTAVSQNVQVRVTEYCPFFEHSMHVHSNQEEIIFILSGKGFSESTDGTQAICAGDVVFVPAGVAHATKNPNAEPMTAIIIKTPPDV